MRVLIATELTDGASPSDHHFAVDGELVTPVVIDCPDAECDVCPRAWVGLVSRGLTTTAMVVERPGVTDRDLRRRVHDLLDDNGTIDLVVQATDHGEYEVDGISMHDPVVAVDELIDAHLGEIREICAAFPEGTVVSRLGALVSPRILRDAA